MPMLDDIVLQLQAECQNAPEDTIRDALLEALGTFLRRSRVWTEELPISLHKGSHYAQADAPRAAAVVAMSYIRLPAGEVLRQNVDYYLGKAGEIFLYNEPAASCTGQAHVSLGMGKQAREVPAKIWEQYGATIRNGTLFHLKSMHGREWFEPQIALYHQNEFERGVGEACHDVATIYKDSPLRMREHYI